MLAIDTVAERCSVAAIYKQQSYHIISNDYVKNTDVILTMLAEICSKLNMNLLQLEHLIVTNGPGSFTGSRIGVVICQMLNMANNCTIYPISTSLALVASANLGNGSYSVVLDARMKEFYYAEYQITDSEISVIISDKIVKSIPESAYECDFQISDCIIAGFDKISVCPKRLLAIHKYLSAGEAIPLYLRSPV